MKRLNILHFSIVFYILLIASGCKKSTHSPRVSMRIYEADKDSLREESKFRAKITNIRDESIIIPFIHGHSLPIMDSFTGEINGDIIQNIYSRGTTYHQTIGFDTLQAGEKMEYNIDISQRMKPNKEMPVVIISFQYYFLDSFEKAPYSQEAMLIEYFLLRNDNNSLKVFSTEKDFNPYIRSYLDLP